MTLGQNYCGGQDVMKGSFRNFVDALDTSGGHILVMLFLLLYFTLTVFWFNAYWI